MCIHISAHVCIHMSMHTHLALLVSPCCSASSRMALSRVPLPLHISYSYCHMCLSVHMSVQMPVHMSDPCHKCVYTRVRTYICHALLASSHRHQRGKGLCTCLSSCVGTVCLLSAHVLAHGTTGISTHMSMHMLTHMCTQQRHAYIHTATARIQEKAHLATHAQQHVYAHVTAYIYAHVYAQKSLQTRVCVLA